MAEDDAIKPVGESKNRETKKAEALTHTAEAKETIKKGPAGHKESPREARADERVHFSRETAEATHDRPGTEDRGLEDRLAWLGQKNRDKGGAASGAESEKGGGGGFPGDMVDKAKGFGGDIIDGMKDAGKDAFNKLKELGGEGLDGIEKLLDQADGVIDKAKNVPDAVKDLISTKNNELTPQGDRKPPHELSPDGTLNVVAWNLHKGEGPNDKGNPPQLDDMISEMRKAKGDVYNLQEVSPEQAQKIADAMGMKGYFTRTTPNQGNMMLVNPELKVESNEKVNINGDIAPGDAAGAVKQLGKWLKGNIDKDNVESQSNEPRAAQVLRVKTPDGKTATLWNTHLTALKEGGLRDRQVEKIIDYTSDHSSPGEPVIGGGDLNSTRDSAAIEKFREQGFSIDGADIDWISSRNTEGPLQITRKNKLFDERGIQISDHPMVISQVTL